MFKRPPLLKKKELSGKHCCHDFDYKSIYDVIYHAKTKIASLVDSLLSKLEYGYGCECNEKETLNRLNGYIASLERIKKQFLSGDFGCQKCKDTQRLVEKVRDIAADYCLDQYEDLTTDDSLKEQWVLKNPYCVPRERYEKLAYLVCGKLQVDFKVTTTKDVCNLAYDIAVKKIDCNTLATIAAQKKTCDLGYKLKMTKKECKLSFDASQVKKNCGMTLDAYSNLIKCNISPSFIQTICESGLSIDLNEVDEVVISSSTMSYNLNNFELENFSVSNCDNCDATVAVADNSFLDKLAGEYSIKSSDKQEIAKIYG